MRECAGRRFYHNGKIKACKDFPERLLWEGENLYEVVRVIEGVLLFWEDHLERLYATARLTGRQIPEDMAALGKVVQRVIEEDGITDGNLRILYHYEGAAARPRDLLVYRVPHHYPPEELYRKGVSCMLYQAERPRPAAKIVHAGLRLSVYQQLLARGDYEALLVDRTGHITEGSRSNVFFIREDTLLTAPDGMVLAGISRKHLLALCHKEGITVARRPVKVDELERMEAAFLTGTSIHVLPIRQVEAQPFDPGHPLLQRIIHLYRQHVEAYVKERKKKKEE